MKPFVILGVLLLTAASSFAQREIVIPGTYLVNGQEVVLQKGDYALPRDGAVKLRFLKGLDIETEKLLLLYPNPADKYVKLTLHVRGRYQILDTTGSVVLEGEVDDRQIVNTERLSEGLYILRVESSRGVDTQKLYIRK